MSVVIPVRSLFQDELKDIISYELLPYAFLQEHFKAYNIHVY